MWTQANIFDPISDELDQAVFDGNTPKQDLMDWIADNIEGVMPEDLSYYLALTGSITTFQYSPTSDIDVSVFPEYPEDEEEAMALRKKLIQLVVGSLDGMFFPGTTHPMQHYVVPPGIEPEDLYQPGIRSAWDFRTKEWIVPPEKGRSKEVEKEMPDLFVKATQMAEKMELMLDHNPHHAIKFFNQIHKKRQLDMAAGLGDYSEGNIIYKFLLHMGYFDRLEQLGVHIASVAPEELLDLDAEEDVELGNHLYHVAGVRLAAWTDPYWIDQKSQIAEAYNAMPTYDAQAVSAWKALGAESIALAEKMKERIQIEITDDPEPYATAEEMFADLRDNNHMWVSRANCDHPVWTEEENVAFRIVHDGIGHYQSGGKFSWRGENLACSSHFPYVSALAREALFTECIGQVAYRSHYGSFGPQKVGFLTQFLQPVQEQEGFETQPVYHEGEQIYHAHVAE